MWYKLFWNNFLIISVFCVPRNHVWSWNKIISAAEGVPKFFQNYFGESERVGKYLWAIVSLWNDIEIISGKFPRAAMKLFQADVEEGRNSIISHVTTA